MSPRGPTASAARWPARVLPSRLDYAAFAAIGDVQFLPGYSVLLSATRADRLLDLPREQRRQFLDDMDLPGVVHTVCTDLDPGFRLIN